MLHLIYIIFLWQPVYYVTIHGTWNSDAGSKIRLDWSYFYLLILGAYIFFKKAINTYT